MYGFSLFFRLVWRAFTTNKGRLFPLTPKRFLLQCLFVPAMLYGKLQHSVAFFLDDIFFPGYRSIEVKEPVFLVGIPRSGTTFLHRLLAEDTEHFTTFMFWELVLAPSIIERKCLGVVARVDRALGGFGRKLAVRFDRWLLRDFRKMHALSLFEPEEDEWLLYNEFASGFLLFAFPFESEARHLLYFDEETAPEDKKQIMALYKSRVQRHLYVHGPDKRLLSKNPSFSAKTDSLNETFPDAKILCCVRNPYEAVPSLASLLWFIWGLTPGESPWTPEMRSSLLEVVDRYYRHPMESLRRLPENHHVFIHYDKLIAAPKDTVTSSYEKLGLDMTADYAEKLAAQQEKARAYKSSHTYSAEHYGLTQQDILENYREIFEHYGFCKEP